MKFIYIDESGNTGWNLKDRNQPFHFLAALSVDEHHITGVQTAIRNIASSFFPDQFREDRFEFHGTELRKGKGYFRNTPPDTRIEIAKQLMSILGEYDIDVFIIGIEKEKYYASVHPHQAAFVLLVERLNPYLKKHDQLGLLICDENHDIEQPVINDLTRFQEYSTNFGYRSVQATEIVDSVHFVKSHNNPIIQLADMVAYFSNRRRMILRKYGEEWNDKAVMEKAGRVELADLELYQTIRATVQETKMFP